MRPGYWMIYFGLLVVEGAMAREAIAEEIPAPLAVSSAMSDFLAEQVNPRLPPHLQVCQLVRGIFGPDRLGFRPENGQTRSAVDSFETRRGNCVSLAFMVVAMARQAGFEAWFQQNSQASGGQADSGTPLSSLHMNAVIRAGGRAYVIDFSPMMAPLRGHRLKALTDAQALAVFFNNQACSALLRNDISLARVLVQRAMDLDADSAATWTTLGACHRMEHQMLQARAAYERALALDPQQPAATRNLVRLHIFLNQLDQAEQLLAGQGLDPEENPAWLLRRAGRAVRNQDISKATEWMAKARRVGRELPEIRTALTRLEGAIKGHADSNRSFVAYGSSSDTRWDHTPRQVVTMVTPMYSAAY